MRPLHLSLDRAAPLRALFLGAHCDDIEIGCGGTVLDLARRGALDAHWVVLTGRGAREQEAERSAARFLAGARSRALVVEGFRDGYLPYEGARVKDFFESLKARVDPDVIFTPQRDDWHQDHRVVSELTWNTFRDHVILEYEVPKYDPDTGAPNVFTHLDDAVAEEKVQAILESYASQTTRPWFTRDTLLATMRLRGVQARAPRYAEGFYARKLVLG
jgi:LmbE family N-acetylglucosaminyl deacetylase